MVMSRRSVRSVIRLAVLFAFVLLPTALFAQQSPWERAALNLEATFTGPLARSLALVAIVVGGLMFMLVGARSARSPASYSAAARPFSGHSGLAVLRTCGGRTPPSSAPARYSAAPHVDVCAWTAAFLPPSMARAVQPLLSFLAVCDVRGLSLCTLTTKRYPQMLRSSCRVPLPATLRPRHAHPRTHHVDDADHSAILRDRNAGSLNSLIALWGFVDEHISHEGRALALCSSGRSTSSASTSHAVFVHRDEAALRGLMSYRFQYPL